MKLVIKIFGGSEDGQVHRFEINVGDRLTVTDEITTRLGTSPAIEVDHPQDDVIEMLLRVLPTNTKP